MFDPDFDSDITIDLINNSTQRLKITYKTPFGEFEEVVSPKDKGLVRNIQLKDTKKSRFLLRLKEWRNQKTNTTS